MGWFEDQTEALQASTSTFRPETDSERERNLALARKADAEARKATAEAEAAEIVTAAERREEAEVLAGDLYHHVYQFSQVVTDQSVASCIKKLTAWSRLEPKCSMTVIFNSPGGEVIAGMALFDFLLGLRGAGHRVTTKALGIAASMAGILLQAGDHRVMGREAWVLIHEAAFASAGKTFEVEDRLAWVKKVQERIINIFFDRADGKISRAAIKKNWARTDWWLSSVDCLKYGFVDEVC